MSPSARRELYSLYQMFVHLTFAYYIEFPGTYDAGALYNRYMVLIVKNEPHYIKVFKTHWNKI